MNDACFSILLLLTGVILRIAVPVANGQAAWPPDEAQLKAYLMGEFIAYDGYDGENTRRLKAGGVSDEQLRRVLAEIYTESEAAFEQAKDQYARMASTLRRENAVREFGVCADATTKAFLLDLAADKSKDGFLRTVAIGSYLRAANTEETRDALIRFLISEERMDSQSRSSIVAHAGELLQEVDLAKKRAVIETLYTALASEDAKWLFRVYDNILFIYSRQYANSPQRQDILQQLIHAKPTCKADDNAMPGLEATWHKLRKQKTTVNVNTNLGTLKARDFSQPPPEGDPIEAKVIALEFPAVSQEADVSPKTEALRLKKTRPYAIIGVVALALATGGLWMFKKQHKSTGT